MVAQPNTSDPGREHHYEALGTTPDCCRWCRTPVTAPSTCSTLITGVPNRVSAPRARAAWMRRSVTTTRVDRPVLRSVLHRGWMTRQSRLEPPQILHHRNAVLRKRHPNSANRTRWHSEPGTWPGCDPWDAPPAPYFEAAPKEHHCGGDSTDPTKRGAGRARGWKGSVDHNDIGTRFVPSGSQSKRRRPRRDDDHPPRRRPPRFCPRIARHGAAHCSARTPGMARAYTDPRPQLSDKPSPDVQPGRQDGESQRSHGDHRRRDLAEAVFGLLGVMI